MEEEIKELVKMIRENEYNVSWSIADKFNRLTENMLPEEKRKMNNKIMHLARLH